MKQQKEVTGVIGRNIAEFRRALRETYCPEGWQTRAEYDDILAALNGHASQIVLANSPYGRPRKWRTDEEIAVARAEAKRRYRQKRK